MPFKFVYLCDLFARLEAIEERDPPLLPPERKNRSREAIEQWFRCHRRAIDSSTTDDVALLSSLFPERRTDRVYWLQDATLARHLGRCLKLGSSRIKQLQAYKTRGNGDLALCVERVLKQAENPQCLIDVNVEEVDNALNQLASRCRFSGPKVRSTFVEQNVQDMLEPVYLRLQSREAKWLTRLILKDLAPVVLDERLVQNCYHFLLVDLLSFQSTFEAAVALLRSPGLMSKCASPGRDCQGNLRELAAECLIPKVGVKVGRPQFDKARSMKHCLGMVNHGRFSVERKYDGEYCQIHVDLTKGAHCLQIFSKSGKDSTQDRKGVHRALLKCLNINSPACNFTRNAILEGELLVFTKRDNAILPFHKIRKHVSRSGVYLGTEKDSQPHEHEQLMIMFYDLLLLDDRSIMTKPYEERRRLLKTVVQRTAGEAEFASREKIDFSSPNAAGRLVKHFARTISERQEGLILKPSDGPYFAFVGKHKTGARFIKLKKDYIQNLGDTADFAVVGASYNARDAQRLGVKGLRWTLFHIGCLENKGAVDRFGARPSFRVVDALNSCISRKDLKTLSAVGHLREEPFLRGRAPENYDIHIYQGACCTMDVTFKEPFVFEVLGSGFDRSPNQNFFTLRHPRVLKIHWDRTFKDTVSVDELRDLAEQAGKPIDATSQEDRLLLRLLRHSNISSTEWPALNFSPWNVSPDNVTTTPSPPTSPETREAKRPDFSASKEEQIPLRPHERPSDQIALQNGDVPSSACTLPRRSKKGGPAPLIHVDTVELLPGELCPGNERQSHAMKISEQPKTNKITIADSSSVKEPEEAGLQKRKLGCVQNQDVKLMMNKRPRRLSVGRRDISTSPPLNKVILTRKGAPLGDITEKVPQRPGPRKRRITETKHGCLADSDNDLLRDCPASAWLNSQTTTALGAGPVKADKHSSGINASESRPQHKYRLSCLPQTSMQQAGRCFYAVKSSTLSPSYRCPFSNAAVYVAPCIAEQRWVVDDLLPGHGATWVYDTKHFRREAMGLSPLGDVVGESQAYAGLSRVVLIESRRRDESAAVIADVLGLGMTERVEFYDWRVLEVLAEAECREEWDCETVLTQMSPYYYGETRFDDRQGKVVFLPGDACGDELTCDVVNFRR